MHQIEGLIFDMDGTIVDNMAYHHEAWMKFLNSYNIDTSDFYSKSHGNITEIIIRLFGQIEEAKIIQLGEEKEALYRKIYGPHVQEVDGLSTLLNQAKSNRLKTALATMGDAVNIDFTLSKLKVANYFDVIVGGHEVKRGKPHPDVFLKAMDGLGLNPENCLVFEDTRGGIEAALKAGVKVVGIKTSHSEAELLSWGVTRAINNFIGFSLNGTL